jgi:hypothetical protein
MIDERRPNFFQRETWQTSVSKPPSKRMVGRCTASSIASASRKSFLLPLRKALTYRAGMSLGS